MEIEITTPRGANLAGTLIVPVDSTDAAVIFSHPLLCDRESSPHFPELAARYRALGYATLIFDYSGHGLSDDQPITMDRRTEDLRAASGWLADQGFTRQILHAHSTGSISALKSGARAVEAVFLSSPITGPMDFDWEAIFSPEQLEELEKNLVVRIADDSPGPRTFFELTPQTLLDLSLNSEDELLEGLSVPTFALFDELDVERGVSAGVGSLAARLPANSIVEVARQTDFSQAENLDRLGTIVVRWALRNVPPRPGVTYESVFGAEDASTDSALTLRPGSEDTEDQADARDKGTDSE